MARYFVRMRVVYSQVIEVDAIDEATALAAAAQCLETGVMQDGSEMEDDMNYEYSLDTDEWRVFE